MPRSRKVMKDVLTAILFIMLMVLPSHGAFGVELFGAGSPEVALAFSTLAEDYLFTRDDVSIKFTEMATSGSALTAYRDGLVIMMTWTRVVALHGANPIDVQDFASFDRAVPADLVTQFGDYVQFPIVGVALTMAYRLSEFNASDPNITLDRETLGRIWSGSISSWNDSAIQQLNPLLAARLPNKPIQLGLVDDSALSVSQIAKIGLSSFSAEFAAALAAANDTFALMAPLFGGRATVLSTNTSARTNFLKNTDGGMTFITYSEAVAEGLRWANMINRAGQVVTPSPDAVRAAMQDFIPSYNAGQFAVDIVDGNGSASWPLAFTAYFSLSRNITAVDCTNVEELLNWLAWVLTNDAADSALRKVNFAPLDTVLATKLLSLMNTVQCNSEQAYVTSYIVGTGPAMPIYTSWSVAYSADDVDVKFYTDDDTAAKQQLVDYDEDFAASNNGLAQAWRDKMPDAALVPVIAYAIVPGYNLPELAGLTDPLVLSFDTLAAIYENNLTMWDDERIKAINSAAVAAALPHQAIVVITESIDSAVTQLFTSVLSATVPEFNATVGTGTLVNFPVLGAGNRSITTASPTGVIDELVATPYSFAFWDLYDITLARSVSAASLINTSGNVVAANLNSVVSAINDYLASSVTQAFDTLSLGEGAGSWPLAAFGSFVYRSTSMTDCVKATALADFLLWTQTSATSLRIAKRQGFVLASSDAELKKRFFDQLKAFTCAGVPVSSVYGCISGSDSELCSGFGSCVSNSCLCNSGREGQYCQLVSSSSAADSLAVILGVVLPVVCAIALLVCLVAAAAWFWARQRRGGRDDWEINYDELEVGDLLGSGGYGEVHRAMWKGTEVAVKVIASEKITKEMEKNFKDEVQVMTALRHPNVVLFMAASTKAPKMCIVMEYMGLGCLYELLHNELIPEIPFQLKAKMAYQGAKGMHFLHSSGIVHRDLKSLNLLLDHKWNVKVSDFGLTKFRENMKKGDTKEIVGSIHWVAPEILNETSDVDYILADVYSFGIVLWELLTREQPYFGLSPAAVAVAVIRDNLRPQMPDNIDGSLCPSEYEELITNCWHQDPTIRPTFLEIMTRLSTLIGDSSMSTGYSRSSSSSSSSASLTTTNTTTNSVVKSPRAVGKKARNVAGMSTGSWTLPTSSHSGSSTSGSGSATGGSKNLSFAGVGGGPAVRAPEGEVTLVFSDITRAASLWEANAAAMRDATLLHNDALRAALKRHRGYEAMLSSTGPTPTWTSGEGSFCMAFHCVDDALAWCADVQTALLALDWPAALLEHAGAAEAWGDVDDTKVVWRGLRVRMGVHVSTTQGGGMLRMGKEAMTRRAEYSGPAVAAAARMTAMAHGGQVIVSRAVVEKMRQSAVTTVDNDTTTTQAHHHRKYTIASLGKFHLPDAPDGAKLYELKVPGLEARFFGGVSTAGQQDSDDSPSSGQTDGSGRGRGKSVAELSERSDRSGRHKIKDHGGSDSDHSGSRSGSGGEMRDEVGEGLMFKEDTFLTSANLCRWIIDFHEISMGQQVGLGSYGVVFRGRWKGVEVAVKRFIKQKLDERRMLEFRAEMAFLSELHHPNIVLFIGACVKRPNLCIVTEFAKQGSLRDILGDHGLKLPWTQRLKMLRSAALGINYLHSLQPVIVHRDLKPSNLLVDENWNVKVADFGFARIKEENATMTRCGTPCWTAPEVIRGEKYDEKADVYSFGIIMWETLTRKQPFAGRNFMGVSLDVLEGRRPAIPGDCPADYRKIMKRCWHASADKRPTMEFVLEFFDRQLGDNHIVDLAAV